MKTTVIIVRHGQSTSNASRVIQGHHDKAVLTELGEQQAQKVGKTLSGLAIDAVYASPLKRARRTCEIIAETLGQAGNTVPEIQLTDQIKEINLPLWESKSFDEVEANYQEMYIAWRTLPNEFVMPLPNEDGTTTDFYPVRDIWERAALFWQTVLSKHSGQTILLVGHSAINRALIGSAIGLGPESLNSMGQDNCAINVLNFVGDWQADEAASVQTASVQAASVQLESLNLTSHLGQPIPQRRSRFKGIRLLLVRHGETDWNRDGRFQGKIDIPLNENGHRQAAQAGEFLKAVKIDVAVSSSMLRPKETAEAILQHHPGIDLETTEQLWEIGHGEWEGMLEAEIEAGYPGMLSQWQSSPETVQMPAGENLNDVWARAKKGWGDIVATYSEGIDDWETPPTVMVVAHDAINKAILCQLFGLGPEKFWQFKQGNGAVSVIDYHAGPDSVPVLSAANITTHLSGSIFDQTAAGAL
ncbi:histidine phosphatase family protein [cf. Phormidesmis sp. LEGE 11477]|uniref:histidine phosphatase family protein n=1 Tax=cf. Phormidesmis sp. LEGE 11477 TaxID=1828680 RepID=UPI00188021F1|nr:histidine phosphatase family protein [cf. Phormidesmis sp. LEGE 11477]MBE9063045.1 histidine phosphatase family protein [cf. Phormidesmis sp. LEGE 11477]